MFSLVLSRAPATPANTIGLMKRGTLSGGGSFSPYLEHLCLLPPPRPIGSSPRIRLFPNLPRFRVCHPPLIPSEAPGEGDYPGAVLKSTTQHSLPRSLSHLLRTIGALLEVSLRNAGRTARQKLSFEPLVIGGVLPPCFTPRRALQLTHPAAGRGAQDGPGSSSPGVEKQIHH